VRRTITVLLVAVVGAIAALAAYDALEGSSPPGESTAQAVDTVPPGAVSTPASVPKWPPVLRRTIRLERAVGTAWEEFGQLDQGSYTLRSRIELPHKAQVDVWIETTTGADVINILGRDEPRACEPRQGRDICRAEVDFDEDPGETLRLLARKLSRGRMLIRLRIEFEKTSADN
jgi:hypothetical protein